MSETTAKFTNFVFHSKIKSIYKYGINWKNLCMKKKAFGLVVSDVNGGIKDTEFVYHEKI